MFQNLISRRDKKAIQYGEREFSYDQLLQYTELYARYIKRSSGDVEQGDMRVMFFSKNAPEYMFAIYGAFRCAATAIPVDVMSGAKELAYIINDARPQVIYTTVDKVEFMQEAINSVGDDSYLPHLFTDENIDASDIDNIEPTAIPAGGEEDVMTIIYTSGTTGSPKGVMLTYSNLWYNVHAVCESVKIYKESTRLLMILPLHHVFAFAGALLAPLYVGAEIHIVETLSPECILETMQRGKTTLLLGVPRLYEGLAKGIMGKIKASPVAHALYGLCSLIGSRGLSKRIFGAVHAKFGGEMEFFVSGGAALPMETGKVFKNLGFIILDGYGMTECAPMISFTRPNNWHIGYCGLMLPGCEAKVEPTGEIVVRGANVMKGYYNRPEETAAIIRDGWLHTGDTAIYDERKGMKITGRIKEIIVTPNGKNINPAEIENEITGASTIIKECAVLLYEDRLQALVYPDLAAVRADGQSSLDELVRAEIEAYNREAMGYKRILNYQIISVELPKTRLGKIQRFKLIDLITSREQAPKEDVSNRSECFKMVKSYLDEQTGVWANGDSHFEIDLALDSLGRVSLLSYVEEHFGVVVGEEQLSELSTLNLLCEYIEQNSESTTLAEGEFSWREILESGDQSITTPRSGFIHWFMHNLLVVTFNLLYRLRAKKMQGEQPSDAVIYVANHRSGFDGGFVSSKLPWSVVKNTYFFAKEKHFRGCFRRFMARKNNVIVMNINTNVRESIQQMYQVLKGGKSIIIFPEGTRNKSGETQSFKESFAILSEVVGAPVVPIAIKGSEGATGKGRLPQLGHKIEVNFLAPMTIAEGESALEFAARVRSAVVSEL
ncbi:MAG: AMP-binding protein [Rikenellaceae bacterium]